MASDIADLQKRIRDFCSARDWDQFHTPKDMAISLTLEASELIEHFQWKNDAEMAEHLKTEKEDVADELSDVFYWVLRMADRFDIDLVDALKKKLVKNDKKYPVEKAKGNNKKYTELV